ncbi:uncharacterized protein BDR25DRAFT_358134, partial [Lindgomyces ingoldianus]
IICANLTRRSIERFAELLQEASQESKDELCQQTISDFEQTFGSCHASTILLTKLIADLYAHQDKLDKAEQMYYRALECSEDVPIPSPEDTICRDLLSSLGQIYLRQGKWDDAERVFNQTLEQHEQAPDQGSTPPIGAISGLYQVYLHHFMTLRQERTPRQISLNYKIQARDMITSLSNLCEKFNAVWPSFLSLLGRVLIWTGKEDDAVIAFQHQFRVAESNLEQGGTVCDGCNRPLHAGMQRFVCKACIDVDLCGVCYEEYEIDGRVSRETAENCQAHPFLAVPRRGYDTSDFPLKLGEDNLFGLAFLILALGL